MTDCSLYSHEGDRYNIPMTVPLPLQIEAALFQFVFHTTGAEGIGNAWELQSVGGRAIFSFLGINLKSDTDSISITNTISIRESTFYRLLSSTRLSRFYIRIVILEKKELTQ